MIEARYTIMTPVYITGHTRYVIAKITSDDRLDYKLVRDDQHDGLIQLIKRFPMNELQNKQHLLASWYASID